MTLRGPYSLAIIKAKLRQRLGEEKRMEKEHRDTSVVCLNRLKGVKTQSGDLSVTDICTQH